MPIQIIDENKRPSTSKQFGQAFANLGQAAGQAIPQYLKDKTQTAELAKQGINVKGIYDPSMRQLLATNQLSRQKAIEDALAEAGGDPLDGQQAKPGQVRQAASPMGNEEIDYDIEYTKPKKGKQSKPFTSQNVPREQVEKGNLPLEATGQNLQKIKTGDEIDALARQEVARLAKGGHLADYDKIRQRISTSNEQNKAINTEIEAERQRRVTEQERYGGYGTDALKKINSDLPFSPEIQAMFQKYGEELASENKSEADIKKALAQRATELSNDVSNLINSKANQSLVSKLERVVKGKKGIESRDLENQLRMKVDPLVQQGLHDLARYALNEMGIGPLLREKSVSNLSEQVTKDLGDFRKINGQRYIRTGGMFDTPSEHYRYSPEDQQKFIENLGQVLTNDPNTNLILLRDAYDKKGVNWETFNQGINYLFRNDVFKPNSSQKNQLSTLESPDIEGLGAILHAIGLKTK